MKSLILFIILNIIVVAESSQNFVWNPKKWLNENEIPNETNDISKLKTSLQEGNAEIEKLKNMISELKHKEKENSKCELKDKQIQECQLNVMLLNKMIENEPCGENIEEKRVALTFCTKLASEYEIKLFNFTERNQKLESENLRLSNNLKNISGKFQNLKSDVSTKHSEIQNLKSQLSNKLKVEIRETYRKNKNLPDDDNQIMESACESDETSVVTAILDLGFNIDTLVDYRTCLRAAANSNRVKLAKVLMDRGADMEIGDIFENRTPLIIAAYYGHLDMVKLLVERGANLSARNTNDKKTALGYAKQQTKQDVIKYLLSKSAPE